MRRKGPLVVFETDGISLRGAIVSVDRAGTVRVERLAESRRVDPSAALTEVAERLGGGGRLPPHCIVVTAEAIGALVRLPITKAKSPAGMAQMVRWELEPFLAQQTAMRPLGSILVGLGILKRRQVREVLAAQTARREQGSRDGMAVRFGETARTLGYLTEAQLAEALALQARLTESGDDDYVCGWSPEPRLAGEEGSPWLVAGMPRGKRRWWSTQVARHGLKLQGLYPLLGCAGAALADDSERIVVEADRDLVACAAVQRGTVTSLQVLPLSHDETPATVCRELLEEKGAREALVCGRGDPESLVAALPSDNGRHVTLLEPPLAGDLPEGTSRAGLAGLVGAARHALGQVPASAAVRIPVHDLRAPLHTRPAFWWAVAAGAVLLLFLVGELALARSERRAHEELARVEEPWRKVDAEITRLKEQADEAKSLREEIARAREERKALQARVARLEAGPRVRAGLLPFLLDALAESASPEIVLNRLVEEKPGEIRVEGWALTERAVRVFTRSVATRARARGLRVAEQTTRADPAGRERGGGGGGGGGGYAFDFCLRPTPEEDS